MLEMTWLSENECGLWCEICGSHLASPEQIDDEEFEQPECCPQCGAPDEFDPEAAGFI